MPRFIATWSPQVSFSLGLKRARSEIVSGEAGGPPTWMIFFLSSHSWASWMCQGSMSSKQWIGALVGSQVSSRRGTRCPKSVSGTSIVIAFHASVLARLPSSTNSLIPCATCFYFWTRLLCSAVLFRDKPLGPMLSTTTTAVKTTDLSCMAFPPASQSFFQGA